MLKVRIVWNGNALRLGGIPANDAAIDAVYEARPELDG